MDREHLQERLTEIEAALPLWLADAEDRRDFWSAFAEEANDLARSTEPVDKDFVREQLDRMLRALGLMNPRAVVSGAGGFGLASRLHEGITPS